MVKPALRCSRPFGEYGLERLTASGEDEATRRAHAAYFLVLAEEVNLPLTTPEMTNWLALCDAEHDNLRAALDWLIARDNSEWALRLGLALYWFWEPREHLVEGRERLEAILKMRGAQRRTKVWANAAELRCGSDKPRRQHDLSACIGRRSTSTLSWTTKTVWRAS